MLAIVLLAVTAHHDFLQSTIVGLLTMIRTVRHRTLNALVFKFVHNKILLILHNNIIMNKKLILIRNGLIHIPADFVIPFYEKLLAPVRVEPLNRKFTIIGQFILDKFVHIFIIEPRL